MTGGTMMTRDVDSSDPPLTIGKGGDGELELRRHGLCFRARRGAGGQQSSADRVIKLGGNSRLDANSLNMGSEGVACRHDKRKRRCQP